MIGPMVGTMVRTMIGAMIKAPTHSPTSLLLESFQTTHPPPVPRLVPHPAQAIRRPGAPGRRGRPRRPPSPSPPSSCPCGAPAPGGGTGGSDSAHTHSPTTPLWVGSEGRAGPLLARSELGRARPGKSPPPKHHHRGAAVNPQHHHHHHHHPIIVGGGGGGGLGTGGCIRGGHAPTCAHPHLQTLHRWQRGRVPSCGAARG